MDINQKRFRENLLPMLDHISNASFVTIDLEMSGIPTRSKNSPGSMGRNQGKPTLQQQYEEIKWAAETFQILQLGITCVEEDREKEFYIARPFNFTVSPLTLNNMEIGLQRNFSFSSSACDFLSKNGFDFGKVFREGVTYLSREEEKSLREQFIQRAHRKAELVDIIIMEDDTKSLQFVKKARQSISDWQKTELEYVNISDGNQKLNAFQRRLIYQLVRNEFSGLRAFGRSDNDFMQVEKQCINQENKHHEKKLKRLDYHLCQQKGLGWLFGALSGSDLVNLDPLWLYNQADCEPEKLPGAIALRIKNLSAKLQAKRHAIVGHNLFMDLGFLYKTFIGSLPETVEEFQQEIHNLFPLIIDTKFLATHGQDVSPSRSSLKELLEPLRRTENPMIILHEDHLSYGVVHGKDHEAGFDKLFVKLGAKLAFEQAAETAPGESSLNSHPTPTANAHTSEPNIGATLGVGLMETFNRCVGSPPAMSDDAPPPESIQPSYQPGTNPYAALYNIQRSDEIIIEPGQTNPAQAAIVQWLPHFTDPFWAIYANKLRVNAIDCGVCNLAAQKYSPGELDVEVDADS